MAFEVFRANQDKLLNPDENGKRVGKVPFTLAADKADFPGSAALIKDSQEAKLNMHKLAEALRPVWEDPDGDKAKEILAGDKGIKVELTTDSRTTLTDITLKTTFNDGDPLDLKKILHDRVAQGINNFFIAMKEAFDNVSAHEVHDIKPLSEINEVSIFLAGNSSRAKLVMDIFAEYLDFEKNPEKECKAQQVLRIYPTLKG